MKLNEAMELQGIIAMSYPFLDVAIKPIEQGDVYTCFLETGEYYLWSQEDWIAYLAYKGDKLYRFTEEGHAAIIGRMKESMQHTKKRGQEIQGILDRV